MTPHLKDRTIALAGVMQAATLVGQIARNGQCSGQAAEASLASIFVESPSDTAATFGGIDKLQLGLRTLSELLGGGDATQLSDLQVALSLLKLGRQLQRDKQRVNELYDAIALCRTAWEASQEAMDPSVTSQLADAYQQHISSLSFRIKVQGNPTILKNPEKVQLIRSFLMAGLRAAILWRQVGGNQWRLITQRKAMVHQALALI